MGFAGLPARSGAASSKTSSFTAANGSGRRFLGLRPSVPPDRTGEGGDRRRKAPAGDRYQRDLADDLRVGNEPSEDARYGRRKLRDKADAETGGDHHLDPVLALATDADLDRESVLVAAGWSGALYMGRKGSAADLRAAGPASICSRCGRTRRPTSVRCVRLCSRRSSSPPSSSSSLCTARVNAGCEALQLSAARVKFKVSQSARK